MELKAKETQHVLTRHLLGLFTDATCWGVNFTPTHISGPMGRIGMIQTPLDSPSP